ncbi:hypothetical protein JHD49_10520 [Sulfurimonas sp. SAG-AH-194-C21]|nr:hypothetical protein [Sulfurimonas sp. SAG-AH-194-C21]MDF1884375.1 hypothetical protein [Sulfurimonas sp. SAG-AH-194-C21]
MNNNKRKFLKKMAYTVPTIVGIGALSTSLNASPDGDTSHLSDDDEYDDDYDDDNNYDDNDDDDGGDDNNDGDT